MLHITTLLNKARTQVETAAKTDPGVLALKRRCDEVAAELRRRKIPVVRVEYPTKKYEGAIIVLENTRWVLAVQIPDAKSMQVELTNLKTDSLQAGRKVKTYRDLLVSIKTLIAKSKEKKETKTSSAGVKKAIDRTIRPTKTTVPTDMKTAAKVRNWLVKTYGAEPLPSWNSNPYDDTQKLEAKISPSGLVKMVNDLRDAGFHAEGSKYSGPKTRHLHFVRDKLWLSWSTPTGNTLKPIFIDIYGPKKAKRSDLPYYD